MKIVCLLWGPFGHRMDELSAAVGGRRFSITLLYGPRYFAPLRYLALFFRTLLLLALERPDVVYAQNPPVFCPLTSLLYCRASGRRLVVDHHSVWRVKTMGGPVGRAIGFLEALVARAADANTAPHRGWGEQLASMGAGRILVVHDHVGKNPYGRDEKLRAEYAGSRLLAIASHGGHPLERLETEVAAASGFEDLTLLITGPPSKLSSRLKGLPRNVRYLGLLPMEGYLRLKASCDFALNITDEPFTLSHVLFEYLASSLPVVATRPDVKEDLFGDSLLFVESSSLASVSRAVGEMVGGRAGLAAWGPKVARRFEELTAGRSAEISALRSLIMTKYPRKADAHA